VATRKAGPVGRADVLGELRRVVDQAVAGRGQIVLLAGEAGIGKTTMLAAAADYAESRGIRVAWGWGWPGGCQGGRAAAWPRPRGRQVPAADLVAAAGAGLAGRADLWLGADEMLDATARRQIRARLADLGEDIAEAESWNDPERAARVRAERDALLRDLAAAVGPAGQPRLLGDQSERARKAVTARIRDIIGRIEQVHPALAGHLRESVTTGTRCCYSPPVPVSWRL
jgi:AAA ATPase domain